MKEKIILGTVQLGLPYGINNNEGQPSTDQAYQILDTAYENNIRTLDTADAYGESVSVIGKYIGLRNRNFAIINKFKLDRNPLSNKLDQCLRQLHSDTLSCYMYHHFADYQSKAASGELAVLKENGRIERIGVSIYDDEQLAVVVRDPTIDVIQLPVNVLDLSERKSDLLRTARVKGKEIHARSVYLQGLLVKDPNTLTGNLTPMRHYLTRLGQLAHDLKTDLKAAAFNFVLSKDFVDFVVVGVDRANQLANNLSLVRPGMDWSLFDQVQVSADHRFLLNPSNWKP